MVDNVKHILDSVTKIKRLRDLLKENGEVILKGEVTLTFSVNALFELNNAIDSLKDRSSPLTTPVQDDAGWNDSLYVVIDFVAKAPALKLHTDEGMFGRYPSLNMHPVHVAYFTSLRHLTLTSVPATLIQDLLKFRPRLLSLTANNCIAPGGQLQSLLEVCGQDVSMSVQWATLIYLNLACNGLRELDGSLRLCPVLEILDLSRNRLTTTDVYLGYLMELKRLDLRYNCLISLPMLAATAKKRLHYLFLAGNNLTDITGLEELHNLTCLDLSHNHISQHSKLAPLKELLYLQQLDLRGCPISLRKQHRLLTLRYISATSLTTPQFELDGSPARSSEVKKLTQPSSRSTPKRFAVGQTREGYTSVGLVINNHTRPNTEEDELLSSSYSSRNSKRKNRKKPRPRTMEIADMDTSTGAEPSSQECSPSTSPNFPSRLVQAAHSRKQLVSQTRQELEDLRRHYGDNWLQAIADQKKLPTPEVAWTGKASIVPQNAAAARPVSVQANTSDGEQDILSEVNTVQKQNQANSLLELFHNSESTPHDSGCCEKPLNINLLTWAAAVADPSHSQMLGRSTSLPPSRFVAKESSGQEHFPSPLREISDVENQKHTEKLSLEKCAATTTTARKEVNSMEESETKEIKTQALADDVPDSLLQDDQYLQEVLDESEPFIATVLAGRVQATVILVVASHYLLEKDINGKVQESLDLQCLENAKINIEETCGETNESNAVNVLENLLVKVHLEFSYIRKDKRSRTFIMEDEDSAKVFLRLITPFLQARRQAAREKLLTEYQCLKCNEIFIKEERAGVHPESIPGASRTKESFGDVLECPCCSSDHVIRLEPWVSSGHGPKKYSACPEVTTNLTDNSGTTSFISHMVDSSQSLNRLPVVHSLLPSQPTVVKKQSEKSNAVIQLTASTSSADDGLTSGRHRSNAFYVETKQALLSDNHAAVSTSVKVDALQTMLRADNNSAHGSIQSHYAAVQGTHSPACVDSDITVVNLPSSAASGSACSVSNQELIHCPGISISWGAPNLMSCVDSMGQDASEISPVACSPLSSSVCSSMISSLYINKSLQQPRASISSIYDAASDGQPQECDSEFSIYDGTITDVPHLVLPEAAEEELAPVLQVASCHDAKQDDDDQALPDSQHLQQEEDPHGFYHLDHRLALHLMMAVFDNNEEFCFHIKTTVSQYMMEDEYEALVLVTSLKMYILKVNTEDVNVEPKDGLSAVEIQPLAELKHIDVGLGGQTIRLEFSTDCSSYTLIVRNEDKVQTFIQHLSDHLTLYAKTLDLPMSAIFNEDTDQKTLDNLKMDVLIRGGGGQEEALGLYTLGYIARGRNPRCPMSFVVTTSEICLIKTNHQWPSPRLQAPVTEETVGRQFVVLERHKITSIVSLTRHCSQFNLMLLTFDHENSGSETQWFVTMETEKGLMKLVEALRVPWEEAFEVGLELVLADFDLT